MAILSFLFGVVLTWLIMSGLLAQGIALFLRIWWPSSSRLRELKTDQWLLNNPVEPSSGWRLLGYWKETSQYRQACSEMAGLLADKACLSNQDRVLDMGFSSHDQLRVWMDYYQVQSLTAIARDEQQMVRALEHCSHFQSLKLLRGGEKALADQAEGGFDKLLALDCVYHFENRAAFIRNARRALKPVGVLAFTDMVLSRSFRDRGEQRLVQWLGRVSGILVEDMQVQDAYEKTLQEHGFSQVEIVDITEDVLSGYCFWFGQHYQSLSSYTRSKMWIRLKLQVWFIRWMLHRSQLSYQLIIAR